MVGISNLAWRRLDIALLIFRIKESRLFHESAGNQLGMRVEEEGMNMASDQVQCRKHEKPCLLFYHEIRQFVNHAEPMKDSLTSNSKASWQKCVRE